MARTRRLLPRWNPPLGRRGFTLLETVIAMGILGFFFLSLPGFLVLMERIEGENNVRARTLLCAQERMEELIYAARRGVLGPGSGEETLPEGPHEGMERRWDIDPSSLGPGLMRVRVRCSCLWKQEAVESELETLMLNGGP